MRRATPCQLRAIGNPPNLPPIHTADFLNEAFAAHHPVTELRCHQTFSHQKMKQVPCGALLRILSKAPDGSTTTLELKSGGYLELDAEAAAKFSTAAAAALREEMMRKREATPPPAAAATAAAADGAAAEEPQEAAGAEHEGQVGVLL